VSAEDLRIANQSKRKDQYDECEIAQGHDVEKTISLGEGKKGKRGPGKRSEGTKSVRHRRGGEKLPFKLSVGAEEKKKNKQRREGKAFRDDTRTEPQRRLSPTT